VRTEGNTAQWDKVFGENFWFQAKLGGKRSGKNRSPRLSGVVRGKRRGKNMNCHANKCVECTVSECANHCQSENYCSLDKILVGTHETNPTMDQCTDCKSFRKK